MKQMETLPYTECYVLSIAVLFLEPSRIRNPANDEVVGFRGFVILWGQRVCAPHHESPDVSDPSLKTQDNEICKPFCVIFLNCELAPWHKNQETWCSSMDFSIPSLGIKAWRSKLKYSGWCSLDSIVVHKQSWFSFTLPTTGTMMFSLCVKGNHLLVSFLCFA